MPASSSLVEQLLTEQGVPTIQRLATQGVLMVDKYGTDEWRFEAGRFRVALDFRAKVATVSDGTQGTQTMDLDDFLGRVHVTY